MISCQKVFFNEKEITRVIGLGNFHAAEIHGIYNVVLIQDSTNRLVIKGTNDVSTIDAVASNDTLIIKNNKKLSLNMEKNTLELHFKNLEYLMTNNPVNVTSTDTIKAVNFKYLALGEIAEVTLLVDCNYFLVVTSANTLGYFHIYGRANSCTLWQRYGSSILAGTLLCKKAEVINGSVGDMYVNASENINVSLLGQGNIYYYGAPLIEIAEGKGSGKLIRKY
jgi:hypothetical protein